MPSFFFNFITILNSNLVCLATIYFHLSDDASDIFIASIFSLHVFAKLGTEITLIMFAYFLPIYLKKFYFRFHPVFRRKLIKTITNLSKYFKCFRTVKVESESNINFKRNQNAFNVSMLNGYMTNDQQLHFEMLEKFWE